MQTNFSKNSLTFVVAVSALSLTLPVSATLIDRGNGLIFDDTQNITWLQDANYAFTSGYAAANAGPSQPVADELSAATAELASVQSASAAATAAAATAAQVAGAAAAAATAAQQAAAGATSAATGAHSAAAGAQAAAAAAAGAAAGAAQAAGATAAGTAATNGPAGAVAAATAAQQATGAAGAAQAAAEAAAQPGATAAQRATAVAAAQTAAAAAHEALIAAETAEQQARDILQQFLDDYNQAVSSGDINAILQLAGQVQEVQEVYDSFEDLQQAAEDAENQAQLAFAASQQAAAADATATAAATGATSASAYAQQTAGAAASAQTAAAAQTTALQAAEARLQQAQAALTNDPGHIDIDGSMGWDAAVTWADQLSFGGFDDWRLSTNAILCFGGACGTVGNELAHLYENDLSNLSSSPVLFQNIQNNGYWSSELDTSSAIYFEGLTGLAGNQASAEKSGSFFAWAVRDGDVNPTQPTTVSEPMTGAVLGLGLLALFNAHRRRQNQ